MSKRRDAMRDMLAPITGTPSVEQRPTLCRRDIRKLISAAMEEGADGNWQMIEAHYVGLIATLQRRPTRLEAEKILDEMTMLQQEILNLLEIQLKTQKMDGNDIHSGYHIQNSKPESIHELEPAKEEKQSGNVADQSDRKTGMVRAFPLSMVVKAGPDIVDYGPDGAIASWRDLMAAAVVVRSMLGVSPSAYQEACEIMGPENAATAIACVLERGGQINSAGGYLRDLTRKAARGEFSPGPMLMALMRNSSDPGRRSA